ncbi:Pentapeptide repeat-containing protein [Streptomyces sp. 3214.6]|nr:Pentapeptide repeat-containing protein [Streptomyces sp. 3214.6]
MDLTSWADWIRAFLGAVVAYAMTMGVWRLVARAAAFRDPHRHTGRRMALVPRSAVRPHTQDVRRRLRGALAVRRYLGVAAAPPSDRLLRPLVEADRSARVLAAGRRVWSLAVPIALALCGFLLGAWLIVSEYFYDGPVMELLPDLYSSLDQFLGGDGWYDQGSDYCASWSLLTGCEADAEPWWNGVDAGPLFGFALALPVAAWRLRRAALRSFALWARQEPPLPACLDALAACRDMLRASATPPEATVLDLRVAELRAALRDFAQDGLPVDEDRRAELEAHTVRVAATLAEASGQVLRDGTTALAALTALLATVQDRLHAGRWFVLLEPAQLLPAPTPPPGPGPAPAPAAAPVGETSRWQRHMWVATAMPTIPAVLALVFTAVTITQADETLGLTRREQVATTYSDTVDSLGDDSIDVRISSIYALQRIMRDSPSEQPAIVKILAAYVRQHAKMPAQKTANSLRKNPKTRPTEDVAAALEVLGSRTQVVTGESYINLRETFLVGADLAGLNFTDADMRDADLSRADLRGGVFDTVWFDKARMEGALLSSATFLHAQFTETDLTGAWLDGAQFNAALLTSAVLTGAQAMPADNGAITQFDGADLAGANLSGADLTSASLTGANLGKDETHPAAIVAGTNFTDADLTAAHLEGVDRSAADWTDAVLP